MKFNKNEGGRVVPLSVFLKNAPDSLDVVKKLRNDGVEIIPIDNSLGAGKARLMSNKKLDSIEYPSNLKEVLVRETKKLLQKGQITKKEYGALIK